MAIELSALATLLGAGADGATIFHRVLTPVARFFMRHPADTHTVASHYRPAQAPLEVVPMWFEVDLLAQLPEVRVELAISNHLPKSIRLEKATVQYLGIDGVIHFERIVSDDYELPPRYTKRLWCRRHVSDAERRVIGNSTRREAWYQGVVHLRGLASHGGKLLPEYMAHSQMVRGVINRPGHQR